MKNPKAVPVDEDGLVEMVGRVKRAFVELSEEYGFDAAEIEIFNAAADEFTNLRDDFQSKQLAARTARRLKDGSAQRLSKILGNYISRLRLRKLPDTYLTRLGIEPAARKKSPIVAPETAPEFEIEYGAMQHIFRIWEKGSTRRRRRPYGVVGAEIYANFDGSRDDFAAYSFYEIAFRSPHIIQFATADIGKQAHYYLRWLTRRGERSAMSRVVSATIAT